MSKLKAFSQHMWRQALAYLIAPPVIFIFANIYYFDFSVEVGVLGLYTYVFIGWYFVLFGLLNGSKYLIKRYQ